MNPVIVHGGGPGDHGLHGALTAAGCSSSTACGYPTRRPSRVAKDGARRQGQQGHRAADQPARPAGRWSLRRRTGCCSAPRARQHRAGQDIGFVGRIEASRRRRPQARLPGLHSGRRPASAPTPRANSYNIKRGCGRRRGSPAALGAFKVMFPDRHRRLAARSGRPREPRVGGRRRADDVAQALDSVGGWHAARSSRACIEGDRRRRLVRPHRRRAACPIRCCSSCFTDAGQGNEDRTVMSVAELQLLEARVRDRHLRPQSGRVRPRRGRQAVGRRRQ